MDNQIVDNRRELKPWQIVIFMALLIAVSIFSAVYIWDSTSDQIKPANAIDYKVKTPAYNDDWFERNTTGL